MSKKDMVSDGHYKAKEFKEGVGKHIYVWNHDGGPPGPGREAIISSHGVQALIDSAYPAPRTTLYFYCPHGNTLNNPGMSGVNNRRTAYNERVRPGEPVPDYELTKYQGAHGNEQKKVFETYAQIQRDLHNLTAQRAAIENDLNFSTDVSGFPERVRTGMLASRQAKKRHALDGVQAFTMDIITIRHRRGWHSGTVTLFQILDFLETHSYHYDAIHCLFCRGPRAGGGRGWSTSDNTEIIR
jgi:hypothetical protein